jgi:hypothetical protein
MEPYHCPFTAYDEGMSKGWSDARQMVRSGVYDNATNPYKDDPCKQMWRDGYLKGYGIVVKAYYKASLSDLKISWSKEGF